MTPLDTVLLVLFVALCTLAARKTVVTVHSKARKRHPSAVLPAPSMSHEQQIRLLQDYVERLTASRDDWRAKAIQMLERVDLMIEERDKWKAIAETHNPVLEWPEPQLVDRFLFQGTEGMIEDALTELPKGRHYFGVTAAIKHPSAQTQASEKFQGPSDRVRREIWLWLANHLKTSGDTIKLSVEVFSFEVPVKVVEVTRPLPTRDEALSKEIEEAYAEVDAIAPVEMGE